MKNFILTLLLTSISATLTMAQHKVTVNQKGHENSISISQGTDNQTSNDADCSKVRQKTKGDNNTIIIKTDAPQPDTVRSLQGQPNSVSAIFGNLYELIAQQNGTGNGIFITVPDSGDSPNRLATHQKGKNNTISAAVSPSPGYIRASQQGSDNSIAINPCGRAYSNAQKSNSVDVTQKGDGNTVQIIQNNP